MKPHLKVVPPSPDRILRDLINERDRLTASLATIDGLIAIEARRWANDRGEMMLPKIERLRREVGG